MPISKDNELSVGEVEAIPDLLSETANSTYEGSRTG